MFVQVTWRKGYLWLGRLIRDYIIHMRDLYHKYVMPMPYLCVFMKQYLCFYASLSQIPLITQLCTRIYMFFSLSFALSFVLSVFCFRSQFESEPHLEFKFKFEFEIDSSLSCVPRKRKKKHRKVSIALM